MKLCRWLKRKPKNKDANEKQAQPAAEAAGGVNPIANESELDRKFRIVKELVKTSDLFSMLNQQQQLTLYGLYKQATEGNCNTAKPSGMIDAKKWEAWKARSDLSKDQAKELYIKTVQDYNPHLKIEEPPKKIHADDEDDLFMSEEEYSKHAQNKKNNGGHGMSMTFSKPKAIYDNDEKEREEITRFFNCILEENVFEMEELLNQGYDLDLESISGSKAIHYCVDNEKIGALEFLLPRYANMDIQDNRGNTALHIACLLDNDEIVDMLFKRGADIYKLNMEGESPYAISSKRLKEHIDELQKL
jgi:acyl-CoA-binding protein